MKILLSFEIFKNILTSLKSVEILWTRWSLFLTFSCSDKKSWFLPNGLFQRCHWKSTNRSDAKKVLLLNSVRKNGLYDKHEAFYYCQNFGLHSITCLKLKQKSMKEIIMTFLSNLFKIYTFSPFLLLFHKDVMTSNRFNFAKCLSN